MKKKENIFKIGSTYNIHSPEYWYSRFIQANKRANSWRENAKVVKNFWVEEARRYAINSDFWRDKFNKEKNNKNFWRLCVFLSTLALLLKLLLK